VSGEVGILTQVEPPNIPTDRLFLRIKYEGSCYMGCLLFDDSAFCQHIKELLVYLRGRAISEIGSTNLSYTL
jgi:hypothetical protein